MAIESKNLLVAVKAYARGNALPLDASEIYENLAAAQAYAAQANAYEGQTIKVKNADGLYDTYVLQPVYEEGVKTGLVPALTSAASQVVIPEQVEYVKVVTSTADVTTAGILYVIFNTENTAATGYVYNGTTAVKLFEDVDLSSYATTNYVDGKISDLIGGAPEALDTLKEIADWISTSNSTITGYKKNDSEETITSEQYDALTEEEKAEYSPITVSNILSKITANAEAIETLDDKIGEIPEDATATTVIAYIDEKAADAVYDDSSIDGRIGDLESVVNGDANTDGTLANQIATAKTAIQGDTTTTVASLESTVSGKLNSNDLQDKVEDILGVELAEGETYDSKVDSKLNDAIGALGTKEVQKPVYEEDGVTQKVDEENNPVFETVQEDYTVKGYVDDKVAAATEASTTAINALDATVTASSRHLEEDKSYSGDGVTVSVTQTDGKLTAISVESVMDFVSANKLGDLGDSETIAAYVNAAAQGAINTAAADATTKATAAATAANAYTDERLGTLGTKEIQVPVIDEETGEQAKDPDTNEPLFTTKVVNMTVQEAITQQLSEAVTYIYEF